MPVVFVTIHPGDLRIELLMTFDNLRVLSKPHTRVDLNKAVPDILRPRNFR